MKKNLKVVTIGGGSSYTPELAEGLINRHKEFPIKEWILVDIMEGKKQNEIILDLVKRMFSKAGIDINIRTSYKLDYDELKNADFVTTQLRVGRQEARKKDERIAFKHGLLGQETNGIGGQFKGMRTIPVVLDIVEKVKKYANGAWIINFTNPSGMVTQAINKISKYKNFIGVCNVPIGTRKAVAKMWDTDYRNINFNAAGLNHMVFFSKFFFNGKDVTSETIEKSLDPKYNSDLTMKNISNDEWNPTFISALNVLPCSYHKYYYKRGDMLRKGIKAYKKNGTRAEEVMKIEKILFKKYSDPNLDEKPKELSERGGAYYSDVAVGVMCAILNDSREEYTVNVINNGKIKSLPKDWTVEITCKIGKKGATKIDREINLPDAVIPLIKTIKQFELNTINAIVNKSINIGKLAAFTNPLSESDWKSEAAFDELMKAHKKFLIGYK